jgi:hypothetical protein
MLLKSMAWFWFAPPYQYARPAERPEDALGQRSSHWTPASGRLRSWRPRRSRSSATVPPLLRRAVVALLSKLLAPNQKERRPGAPPGANALATRAVDLSPRDSRWGAR